MNRWKSPFSTLLCAFFSLVVFLGVAKKASADFIDSMELGINAGFRVDQLDWNIAGKFFGQEVNVLSELDWNNIEIWQVGLNGKMAVGNDVAVYNTYIRGSFDYGLITDGTGHDTDYHGNNRTLEFSHSINSNEEDYVLDASLGLGFEKKYWQERCTLGWLAGYSYHKQNIRFSNGHQLVPTNEPIIGLDSSYRSKWYGPFASIDIELHPYPRVSLLGSAEYHWSNFEAQANWNLRTDFAHPVSFQQEADDGVGMVGTLKGSYLFTNGWIFDLIFTYRDFSVHDGINQYLMENGTFINNRLNEVNWKSFNTSAGLTYKF